MKNYEELEVWQKATDCFSLFALREKPKGNADEEL
jgi:hypothetical protein